MWEFEKKIGMKFEFLKDFCFLCKGGLKKSLFLIGNKKKYFLFSLVVDKVEKNIFFDILWLYVFIYMGFVLIFILFYLWGLGI